MATNYNQIIREGLWDNNGVFNMILGLCPTMAMTTSATNGFGLGLATAVTMIASNLLVSLLRGFITQEVRIPVYVVIVAAMVTVVDMMMNAWMHELYKILGLFIPLIVANCIQFARIEVFAAKEPVLPSIVDGIFSGIGFIISLTIIGIVREIIGSGTVFADASLLLGPAFKIMEIRVLPEDMGGVLMMILPPGGFLAVGLLIVVKRMIESRMARNIQVADVVNAMG
ncbi:SoxR (2Fe-2S) reducing system protein RsxE [Gammaproteobacteria bacterium]